MPTQSSFSDMEYAAKKKMTRREKFLREMDALLPWDRLMAALESVYPRGERGRPPIRLEQMLRMYVVQHFLGLSDEGTEDAIYDSAEVRQFVGIDLSRETAPDATMLLKFRRRLAEHEMTTALFDTIAGYLAEHGLMARQGSIVDATLIAAPPSTKNRERARDPEMHQTRKGEQWHFGMKAHIAVDSDSGLVHTVVGTAANVADVTVTGELLHGDEEQVHADAGYTGAEKRPALAGLPVTWYVATKRGKLKAQPEGPVKMLGQAIEKLKASIRARVEHPFHVIKNLFKHRKVRYRGLEKNTAHLQTLFGLANIMLAKRRLWALHAQNG